MSLNRMTEALWQFREGQLEALREYRSRHPEIHWKDLRNEASGDTILHVACRLGQTDLVKYLVEEYQAGAIDCRNADNKTALHEAARHARCQCACILLDHGADVNALKKADWTPLMLACTKMKLPASYDTVELLLERGALVNYANKDGWTVAHLVAREGCTSILRLVIEKGVDMCAASKNGRTPLHVAALHGNMSVIQLLIANGVDINAQDRCGNGPLHEAALGGHLEVFKAMVKAGCNVSARNRNGYTILHLAASVGALEIIRAILQESLVCIDCTATDGVTPLHCAARKQQREAFNLLLELGAREHLLDARNRTTRDYFGLDI